MRPRGWRGQAPRQIGQVRKEAAVTSPAWVVVQPLTVSPHGHPVFLHRAAHAGEQHRAFPVVLRNKQETDMLKFIGGAAGIIFIIGLLVVIGILSLIF